MIDLTPATLFTSRLRSRILTTHQARLLIALGVNAFWADDDGFRLMATVHPNRLRDDAALGWLAFARTLADLKAAGIVTQVARFKSGTVSYGVDIRGLPRRCELPALGDEQEEAA